MSTSYTSNTVIVSIHIAIIAIGAVIGYIMGMSTMSTGIGALIGLIVAALAYAYWGQDAIKKNGGLGGSASA